MCKEVIISEGYAYGIMRSYGKGEEYIRKEKEKPSEHKMSLLKSLPAILSGPYEASIVVNENCDIIFVTPRGTAYYDTVRNKLIAKFKLQDKAELAREKSLQLLSNHLENMTDAAKEDMRNFFKDDTPKGWISIEEHLPKMFAMDICQGYTEYKIKYADGREDTTRVADHDIWYHHAKEAGITHWFNE